MRIGFFGKGGSGKTTLTAAYVRNLVENHGKYNVLAIDADHNAHLGESLGIEGDVEAVGGIREQVKEHVKGGREDITMVATTPPSEDSRFIRPSEDDEFLKKYAANENGINLLEVGSYEEEDYGATCYHGKLDSLTYIMNHLLDTERDQVAVDATAGVDTYGSSLVAAYDLNILVVEPTQKAVEVYNEFEELMSRFHSETLVVVNKVDSERDKEFVRDNIPENKVLGFIERSNHLRRYEQGQKDAFMEFVDQNRDLLDRILERSRDKGKNWEDYLNSLKELHISGSEAWWDEYHNEKISAQAETDFNYREVIER